MTRGEEKVETFLELEHTKTRRKQEYNAMHIDTMFFFFVFILSVCTSLALAFESSHSEILKYNAAYVI